MCERRPVRVSALAVEPNRIQIDWSTAEIEDGTLSVRLSGEDLKAASASFDGVLLLLAHSTRGWGRVRLRRGAITVDEVQEGSEADLRHFLESVVMQVNSDLLGPPEDEPQSPSTTDERMRETFREFAGRPES